MVELVICPDLHQGLAMFLEEQLVPVDNAVCVSQPLAGADLEALDVRVLPRCLLEVMLAASDMYVGK